MAKPSTRRNDKVYCGYQRGEERVVTVRSPNGCYRLRGRRDLGGSIDTQFDWGTGAEGDTELALALLADAVGDQRALELFHDFAELVVAGLPEDGWQLSSDFIRHWCRRQAYVLNTPSIHW